MYKQIMLLGLLLEKPMYGQQIREVIEEHHGLLADFIKKPTIYYQLERLASDGYLEIRREPVEAPGPGAAHEDVTLRERAVYHITETGRQHFQSLLRLVLSTYTPGLSAVDTCLFFLHHLTPAEARALLKTRYDLVKEQYDITRKQMEEELTDDAHLLVNDHKITLLDAELKWLERTMRHIQNFKTMPGRR